MKESQFVDKKQTILHLIKSCEKFNLNEKESIETINKISGTDISRRTYYKYKKKLYDKDIFQTLKNSMYNSQAMRYILLEFEYTDKDKGLESDKLIRKYFPDRKDIFQQINKQMETKEEIKTVINGLENQINSPIESYALTPQDNTTIKKEFIRCAKVNCFSCPHGPYYYAYWRDKETKKLIKSYLGKFDPRT